MSKSKAAKRKRKAQAELPNKQLKTNTVITPPPSDGASPEPKNLQTIISDEELDIAIVTLTELAQFPSLIKSKACKPLRTAVHEFRQACTTGINNAGMHSPLLPALTSLQHVANVDWRTEGANLTSRISGALVDGKYTEARILLAEMRIRAEQPKLGALCRWVRDLDIISGLSTKPSGDGHITVKRSAEDLDRLAVVDAILRVVGPTDSNLKAVPNSSDPIAVQEVWNLRSSADREQVYASVLDKTLLQSQPATLSDSLRIIETTEGVDRKPPNHHPALLYTSTPGAVPLAPQGPSISFQPHPVVPGLGLALNVLSPSECKAIIAAGETVNFIPDAPLREDGDISILAHNFYWVVDTAFHDALWSRISPYVPASLGGRKARGINRRFRVYRYVPGAEYRCHIDGAWPPSGILPDDTYVYDASPPGKKQSSLFTFLVYLNDEFEGGETTFFVPAAKEGTLNAYPVKPVMGAVAIFPHGETRGALLHEGTGVRKGAKYVIRTDVEYDVEPSPEV